MASLLGSPSIIHFLAVLSKKKEKKNAAAAFHHFQFFKDIHHFPVDKI
jgi:hypothetical protein